MKKKRRKGQKGERNTRANTGYWELENEAIWMHYKLLNNVVINYKPPLRSWAHPCCFPLQDAADDVCDYKLVLGTCSVWKNRLLLLINSTPCGSVIPSQSGIFANTFWIPSKEIKLPRRCGLVVQVSSETYATACSNAGSLTHWARPGIKPASSWILVRFLTRWTTTGTPRETHIQIQLNHVEAMCPWAGSWLFLSLTSVHEKTATSQLWSDN